MCSHPNTWYDFESWFTLILLRLCKCTRSQERIEFFQNLLDFYEYQIASTYWNGLYVNSFVSILANESFRHYLSGFHCKLKEN